MLRYETLLLIRTEVTDNDVSMIEKQLDKLVSETQGKLNSFDKWGKYRLAFPVKKNTHGVFILARYDIPETTATNVLLEFDRFVKIKCNETVLRHVNIRLAENAPTTYNKPDPIDMSRSGSLDSFFKDNKIENLLHSVDTAKDGDYNLDDEA